MKTLSLKISILLILTFISLVSEACDICPMDEYSSLRNNGYVGVFYSYNHFNGYNTLDHSNNFDYRTRTKKHNIFQDENFYEDSPDDFEAFHTLEFRLNYNLKDKWNFLVSIPYHYNINYYASVTPPFGQSFDSTTFTNGIGDVILGIQRLNKIEAEKWVHRFKYGIGFTLPTGYSTIRESEQVAPNDPAHLPGKGAVDFMLRFNYTVSNNDKIGLITNLLLANNLKSKESNPLGNTPSQPTFQGYNYRFGNRYGGDALFFYVLGNNEIKLIPKIGTSIYYARKDVLNKERVEATGGVISSLVTGIDFRFKELTLQTLYSTPFQQKLNGVQIENSGKIQLGLIYSLKN